MENGIIFRSGTISDSPLISTLANKTWWQTYATFLSKEQISFMLEKIYDPQNISAQINEGVDFVIVERKKKALGFISFIPKKDDPAIYRIEKIYLLQEAQGLGIGKNLINHVEIIAQDSASTTLELNVNRNNPAIKFYEKVGFKIVEEADIPFHQFILNDYIMQKSI